MSIEPASVYLSRATEKVARDFPPNPEVERVLAQRRSDSEANARHHATYEAEKLASRERYLAQRRSDAEFNADQGGHQVVRLDSPVDGPKPRTDAESVRADFIKATERAWQNPDPKGARATTDEAPIAGALTSPADKALVGELAQLVPGLSVEGRPTSYLKAALNIARNEPHLRGRPSDVQSRAEFHLQTESAYLTGDPGGQSSPSR